MAGLLEDYSHPLKDRNKFKEESGCNIEVREKESGAKTSMPPSQFSKLASHLKERKRYTKIFRPLSKRLLHFPRNSIYVFRK